MSESVSVQEKVESLASDVRRLETTLERINLLNQRMSELVGEQIDIDLKYPQSAKFENGRYRNDYGFATAEDKERLQDTSAGIRSIEEERSELDKQLLHDRFTIALKYLERINSDQELHWERTSASQTDHLGEFENWRAASKDMVVTLRVAKLKQQNFMEGVRKVASQSADTALEQSVSQLPQRRELPCNELQLEFSAAPRSFFFKSDALAVPGISFSKSFDPYSEAYDSTTIMTAQGHNAYAFPTLSQEETDRASVEMTALGRKIGIESL